MLQTKVTGEPDPRTGELIAAYIVAAPNAEHLDEDRIRAALSTVLAPYKIPRRISIVDHIPGH